MYCPKCAAPVADEQKFCRSCGLNLQAISQILTSESQAENPNEALPQPAEQLQKQSGKWQHRGIITILVALLVGCLIPISLGLLSASETRTSVVLVLAGVAGLLLFTGSILLLWQDQSGKAPADHTDAPTKTLGRAAKTNKLLPDDQSKPTPEFTERPTEILDKVPRNHA